MEKTNILICENIHEKAIQNLQKIENSNIDILSYAPSKEELLSIIDKYHYICIRSRTKIDKEAIDKAKNLLAVGCFSIGTNQVDLEYAAKNAICVFNAPFSNTRSVAELTMASIIMLLRNIPQKNAALHRGEWQKSADSSFEARKKKLGIIGYGNIGTQLSILASAFGMHVYYYDISPKLSHGNATYIDNKKELLQLCDIITLHVPFTDQTIGMMGKKEFQQMKKGSYLINHARGGLVDEEDLHEALENNIIAGAAIDVFNNEPANNKEKFNNSLTNFDQLLLTPHIGGSTIEAQGNIGMEVSNKIKEFHAYGKSQQAVNFPEIITSDKNTEHCRIISIHNNVPGVLAKVNLLCSDLGTNIHSQFLQTRNDIGYLCFDVDKGLGEKICGELDNEEWNISSRYI